MISVDLDLRALQARGLTPADIVNAVNSQNLILPRIRRLATALPIAVFVAEVDRLAAIPTGTLVAVSNERGDQDRGSRCTCKVL